MPVDQNESYEINFMLLDTVLIISLICKLLLNIDSILLTINVFQAVLTH